MSGRGQGNDAGRNEAFLARRDEARRRLDELTGAKGGDAQDRKAWFETVYREAKGDPAAVPWADLAPKQALVDWLSTREGKGARALDVACGLGDNAEALGAAGYHTTAFDLADEAISWAQRRFENSGVDYVVGDLFDPPADWLGTFDLVHECYTLQALKDPMRSRAISVLGEFLAPGGTLLLISRSRAEGSEADGPPWPLMPSEWRRFESHGLDLVSESRYDIVRPDRVIPHVLVEFRRR
ncbi:class I SAM-dependent methyltransferase [Roseibium sp.]|uniref:class I SAM-dependent methyltransferase n=1 Tax=Roseibium sp. TaxID=1936156 RepID=UPI003A96AD1C